MGSVKMLFIMNISIRAMFRNEVILHLFFIKEASFKSFVTHCKIKPVDTIIISSNGFTKNTCELAFECSMKRSKHFEVWSKNYVVLAA